MSSHIYPEFEKMLSRTERERQIQQKGHVYWFYGLSGSGKSTLTRGIQRGLYEVGIISEILDGDNIRSGLNQDLGFTKAERHENIRRIAEVAKLFVHAGIVVLTAFITPTNPLRQLAKDVIGQQDITDIYVKASYASCVERDPKGLYKKVNAGEVKNFTGKDADFDIPNNPDHTIDTEELSLDQCLQTTIPFIIEKTKTI